MSQTSYGPLPSLEGLTEFFWTAGKQQRLLVQRCTDCGHWQHPPSELCVKCHGQEVKPQAVSGEAIIVAASINYQPWMPALDVPYALAIVELDEQANLRLTTRILGCDPKAVEIGQRVQVVFKQVDDVWLPLFRPVDV